MVVAVSVILSVLDGRAYAVSQRQALAAQEPGWPWKLVIVDHGSGDGSLEDVERLRHGFPELQVLSEVRRGQAHSITGGIDAAKGRPLVFLDQDDEVTPGYLASMALAEFDLAWARVDFESVDPPVLKCRSQANRMKSAYWSGIVVGNLVGAFRGGVMYLCCSLPM